MLAIIITTILSSNLSTVEYSFCHISMIFDALDIFFSIKLHISFCLFS